MAKDASGFIPLRDSSGKIDSRRRGIHPETGEVISLRQFQKLQHQQSQPTATTAKQSTSATTAKQGKGGSRDYYKQELTLFMDMRNKQLVNEGLPLYQKRSEVVRSAEFKAYYKALKPPSKNMTEAQKKTWNSPTGKKAQALIKIGLRSPDADYPVGETPGVT